MRKKVIKQVYKRALLLAVAAIGLFEQIGHR
jgi:hypothetical protein